MIIFETLIFCLLTLLSFISLSGYGLAYTARYKLNILTSFFLGFVILGLLITTIHFFYKINLYINISILLIGIIFFFINRKPYNLKTYNKKIYIYILIFCALIPIFLTHKYHEDFGYYHLPYLITFAEQKLIFGLANTNDAFVHNSLWLNIIGIHFMPKNFNFVILFTFLVYACFIIFCFKRNFEVFEKKVSNYFIIICLFYLILKFTRLSEFGNDIPATIFSIFGIFYFLKFIEVKNLEKKNKFFFLNFVFTIFAILVKFSSIPLILLTMYILLKNYRILFKQILRVEFIIIYLLIFTFLIQQFFYTGCLIFPSKISCLNVSWFNDEILFLRKSLELTNKSYYNFSDIFSKDEYLKDFNWIPFWFQRNINEILEHVFTIIIPIILVLFFSKKKEKKFLIFNEKKIFILFLIIYFIFWFKFSPVLRFAIPLFLSLIFILTINFFAYREITKKIFIITFSIALVFNLSKNTVRLSQKEKIYFGIEKVSNFFVIDKSSRNNFINVYKPDLKNNNNGWQGILCWDIPFLCSYNKITVDKNNGYLFISKLRD